METDYAPVQPAFSRQPPPRCASETSTRSSCADVRAAAVDLDGSPEHLTGSCFVLTPDLSQVLLCFHRKGQLWVQLGGHVESGDKSVAAAAYREAREEGGITDIHPFGTMPVDLHRHFLSSSLGTCRVHWDVGFVAFAEVDAVPVVSAESEAVAWFGVDRLPAQAPEDFPCAFARSWTRSRTDGRSGAPSGAAARDHPRVPP